MTNHDASACRDQDTAPMHAWVDESIRVGAGQYLLAAAITRGDPAALGDTREAMRALVHRLAARGVAHVGLESRGPIGDQRDLAVIVALRSRLGLPVAMRIDHLAPMEEPMLWIPDAIAGAVGAPQRATDIPKSLAARIALHHIAT